MKVMDSPKDLNGDKGFPTGSAWWLKILARVYMVVSDSQEDLHGG